MEYYSSLAAGARSPKNTKLYHNNIDKEKCKIEQIYICNPMTIRLYFCKQWVVS